LSKNIETNTYTKLSTCHIDVKTELDSIFKELPICIEFLHVPGHADESPSFYYDRAPQQVQRNIDMHNASDISNGQGTTIRSTFFPHEKPSHIMSIYQWPFALG